MRLREIIKDSLFQTVIIFFIWMISVSFFSFYFWDSLYGTIKYFFYLLVFLASLLYLFIPGKYSLESRIQAVFILIFITSIFASAYGLYQYFIGAEQLAKWDDPAFLTSQTRAYSFFGNPNLFAAFLLIALPINSSLAFRALSHRNKNYFKNLLTLSISILGILINILALFLSGSRSGIVAFTIVFTIFLLIILALKKVRKFRDFFIKENLLDERVLASIFNLFVFIALIVGFAIIVAIWINPDLIMRFKTIFIKNYSTNDYRMQVWLRTFNLLKENWILGIGLGNDVFRKVYALYMKPGFEALSPYSIYLQIFVESGILGIILFLTILKKSIKVLITMLRANPNIGLAILASLSGLFIQGFFDTVFFRPTVYSIFWFLIASVVAYNCYYFASGEKILLKRRVR